ncbi:MAG TPA: cation diffusion facilitator family transporter [Xanthobacteraceae bacterium]|nr:cation diffusion facilitator family transporter [Xanthobacteraceae bacterium]
MNDEPDHDHLYADHSGDAGAHTHSHAPQDFGRVFAITLGLNVALVALQAAYGVFAHSTALLADAGHNFGDVLGLVLAWAAQGLGRRPPTSGYTYGFRSASILAALSNAVILLVATGAIAWEAIGRLFTPVPVAGGTVMLVAAVGMVVNGFSAWLLMGGHRDLNVHGAFLHMAADAAISFGVVVAGGVILVTGWPGIDPIVSLLISIVIVVGTGGLLRGSINMTLQAVPPGIDSAQVRRYLEHLPGVVEVHDLHIWSMSTTETALTCHLRMPGGHPGDAFLARAAETLERRFAIGHPTLQIEIGEHTQCALAPDHVV